jgi:hypothetical protein
MPILFAFSPYEINGSVGSHGGRFDERDNG